MLLNVQEPHGSCTRLLIDDMTIAHLKTALYPRENCTGPYGFDLPSRARIAHILPSRALHGHVGWEVNILVKTKQKKQITYTFAIKANEKLANIKKLITKVTK